MSSFIENYLRYILTVILHKSRNKADSGDNNPDNKILPLKADVVHDITALSIGEGSEIFKKGERICKIGYNVDKVHHIVRGAES